MFVSSDFGARARAVGCLRQHRLRQVRRDPPQVHGPAPEGRKSAQDPASHRHQRQERGNRSLLVGRMQR